MFVLHESFNVRLRVEEVSTAYSHCRLSLQDCLVFANHTEAPLDRVDILLAIYQILSFVTESLDTHTPFFTLSLPDNGKVWLRWSLRQR